MPTRIVTSTDLTPEELRGAAMPPMHCGASWCAGRPPRTGREWPADATDGAPPPCSSPNSTEPMLAGREGRGRAYHSGSDNMPSEPYRSQFS
jgi:hypothetical protein